jgi:hypothetical protein
LLKKSGSSSEFASAVQIHTALSNDWKKWQRQLPEIGNPPMHTAQHPNGAPVTDRLFAQRSRAVPGAPRETASMTAALKDPDGARESAAANGAPICFRPRIQSAPYRQKPIASAASL